MTEAGAAYVFTRSSGVWSQRSYVKAPNTDGDDRFGSGAALSDEGETLAIGADKEEGSAKGVGGDESDNSAADAGAVYLY